MVLFGDFFVKEFLSAVKIRKNDSRIEFHTIKGFLLIKILPKKEFLILRSVKTVFFYDSVFHINLVLPKKYQREFGCVVSPLGLLVFLWFFVSGFLPFYKCLEDGQLLMVFRHHVF